MKTVKRFIFGTDFDFPHIIPGNFPREIFLLFKLKEKRMKIFFEILKGKLTEKLFRFLQLRAPPTEK